MEQGANKLSAKQIGAMQQSSPQGEPPAVSRGWVASFASMYLGINMAWTAPAQLLIALQILHWFPEPGAKEAKLALIMTAGGVCGLLMSPVWGWISDRTRTAWGPRVPWVVVGCSLSALALIGMAFAPRFWHLVLLWCVFQVMIAAATNVAQAIPPDRVHKQQYGLVSGLMGIGWTLAVVFGTLLGEQFSITGAYVASAGLMLVLVAPFVVRYARRDAALVGEGAPARASNQELSNVKEELRQLPQYRDYRLVFISRLIVTLANNIALFYLLFYLRDHIGLDNPEQGLLLLTVIYAAVSVAAAFGAGWLSDTLGIRRDLVAVSCLVIAVASLLMAFASSFHLVIVAAVVLGIGWGVFMAVDQALINAVLPQQGNNGRDIGVMSLAVAVPNMFAPALAGVAVLHLGGYEGLYGLSAGMCVMGLLVVRLVKGVR